MREITIEGTPRGKGRPRFRKVKNYVRTYTDQDTKSYELKVANAYKFKYDDIMECDAFDVDVIAYFEIPKSYTKKRTILIKCLKEFFTKKPDVDNIGKIILDGLNGVAYRDDAQVVRMSVEKRYVTDDNVPRAEVRIKEYGI